MESPIDLGGNEAMRKHIEKMLATLPEQERAIFTDYLGLFSGRRQTLEEVSRRHGVSREIILEIAVKAFREVRRLQRADGRAVPWHLVL